MGANFEGWGQLVGPSLHTTWKGTTSGPAWHIRYERGCWQEVCLCRHNHTQVATMCFPPMHFCFLFVFVLVVPSPPEKVVNNRCAKPLLKPQPRTNKQSYKNTAGQHKKTHTQSFHRSFAEGPSLLEDGGPGPTQRNKTQGLPEIKLRTQHKGTQWEERWKFNLEIKQNKATKQAEGAHWEDR